VGVLQRKRRRSSGYSNGPSRHWVKVKCQDWYRDNAERHKLFEGPRTRAHGSRADAREEARGSGTAAIAWTEPRRGASLGSCRSFGSGNR
jgi:hypothetical protein